MIHFQKEALAWHVTLHGRKVLLFEVIHWNWNPPLISCGQKEFFNSFWTHRSDVQLLGRLKFGAANSTTSCLGHLLKGLLQFGIFVLEMESCFSLAPGSLDLWPQKKHGWNLMSHSFHWRWYHFPWRSQRTKRTTKVWKVMAVSSSSSLSVFCGSNNVQQNYIWNWCWELNQQHNTIYIYTFGWLLVKTRRVANWTRKTTFFGVSSMITLLRFPACCACFWMDWSRPPMVFCPNHW